MKTTKSRRKTSPKPPIRCAFTLQLKPGAFAEYKRYHDAVWPELVAEIERCGIAQITTFESKGTLFLYSEIYRPNAWKKLWDSKIHDKWSECMKPLMEFKANGKLEAGKLRCIFDLHTRAGMEAIESPAAPTRRKRRS